MFQTLFFFTYSLIFITILLKLNGNIVEIHDGVPFGICQRLCKLDGAAFLKWNRESENCECLDAGNRV